MKYMRYVIGIDGGGTKTESVLVREDGKIIARDIQMGVNGLEIGIETAEKRIMAAVENLTAQLPKDGTLEAVYGGVAACVDYFPGVLDKDIVPKIHARKVRMQGDGGNLISAMIGHKDGACLISGTGSTLYTRINDKLQHYGGWGHLLDTEGSGYTIGRDALKAVFRSFDGRGKKTVLYDLAAKKLGAAPENCLPRIYKGGRPFIATFASCVFEARKMGDEVATDIFNRQAESLAELVRLGVNAVGENLSVVTGGGVFSHFPEFLEEVKKRSPKTVQYIEQNAPQVFGAVIEAISDADIRVTREFRETFFEDYKVIAGMTADGCGGSDTTYDKIY